MMKLFLQGNLVDPAIYEHIPYSSFLLWDKNSVFLGNDILKHAEELHLESYEIKTDIAREYILYGTPHREDGPALIIPQPTQKQIFYYWHGERILEAYTPLAIKTPIVPHYITATITINTNPSP